MKIKKGMRVRYKYREVSRCRSWYVTDVGCVVSIYNRSAVPIRVQARNENRIVCIKRNEITAILKSNKLKPFEHDAFKRCGYQMCCF